MAIYGLQSATKEKILSDYFGINPEGPSIEQNFIYLGLGLTQIGSQVNIETFDELYNGNNYDGYSRARCIFGAATNGKISNVSDLAFPTAEADWTTDKNTVSMIGIFNTLDIIDEQGNVIAPLAVLKLPKEYTISAGETLIFRANSIVLNLNNE